MLSQLHWFRLYYIHLENTEHRIIGFEGASEVFEFNPLLKEGDHIPFWSNGCPGYFLYCGDQNCISSIASQAVLSFLVILMLFLCWCSSGLPLAFWVGWSIRFMNLYQWSSYQLDASLETCEGSFFLPSVTMATDTYLCSNNIWLLWNLKYVGLKIDFPSLVFLIMMGLQLLEFLTNSTLTGNLVGGMVSIHLKATKQQKVFLKRDYPSFSDKSWFNLISDIYICL